MAVELGLCNRQRSLALARPDKQKTHGWSGRVNQCRSLKQRWDPLLPREARDGNDDFAVFEPKRPAKVCC